MNYKRHLFFALLYFKDVTLTYIKVHLNAHKTQVHMERGVLADQSQRLRSAEVHITYGVGYGAGLCVSA